MKIIFPICLVLSFACHNSEKRQWTEVNEDRTSVIFEKEVHQMQKESEKKPSVDYFITAQGDTIQFSSFFRHWFDQDNSVFGNYGTRDIKINGARYDHFLGGLNDAVYGRFQSGGLNTCALSCLEEETVDTDDIFSILSGIPVFNSEDTVLQFKKVNPAFIKWAVSNLIPTPDSHFEGYMYSTVYTNIFSRFFRTLALTYLELQYRYDAAWETECYTNAILDDNNISEYLNRKFGHISIDSDDEYQEDSFYFVPYYAMSFWLRRTIDGSQHELWTGLQKIMQQYDPLWFEKKQRQMERFKKNETFKITSLIRQLIISLRTYDYETLENLIHFPFEDSYCRDGDCSDDISKIVSDVEEFQLDDLKEMADFLNGGLIQKIENYRSESHSEWVLKYSDSEPGVSEDTIYLYFEMIDGSLKLKSKFHHVVYDLEENYE